MKQYEIICQADTKFLGMVVVQKVPKLTLNSNSIFNFEANTPKLSLVTFPKIYLVAI